MDKELDYRLKKIEQSLVDKVGHDFASIKSDDEIDLRELWNVIWAGKIKIIAITMVFILASVLYAISLPNMYKSHMILAPAKSNSQSGLSALASQYGGLAAMAGINLGGGTNGRAEQTIQLVKSWPFIESFIEKYQLKPQIMAANGWNKKTDELVYDESIYDIKAKLWTREVDIDSGDKPEPSSWETYKMFSEMMAISYDLEQGLVNITVEFYSPSTAKEWVELLKKEINDFYQFKDMQEAKKNIKYLRDKIEQTNIKDMQAVFHNMIESQMQTLMLAEVSDEYLFKTIVPAKVAEEKSKPQRALICILGMIIGAFFSLFYVLVIHFVKQKPIS